MHFSIIFNSLESADLSYSLLFVPCPVWQKGETVIANPHPQKPNYQRGDLKALLTCEDILTRLGPGAKQAAIIIHNSGLGTPPDLAALQEDLLAEGFTVNMLSFGSSR